MKRSLFVLMFIMLSIIFSTVGFTAPFITTNPQAGIMSYQLSGTGVIGLPTSIAAQADGSLRLNVANASVGSNTVNITACSNTDAIWGVLCSPALPFTFTRPGVPSIPSGAGLVP